MNADQLKSAGTTLLVILSSVLTVLVASGKITADQSATFSNALQALVPAAITLMVGIWKLLPHSTAAQTEAVSNIPGVKVQVDTSASSPAPKAVKEMANDTTIPNVVPQQKAG